MPAEDPERRSQAPQPHDILSTAAAGPLAVRGGALRVASFGGGAVFSIIAGALLFRHLGVQDTGRYTTALTLSALVAGFTDLGLTAIGIRELSTLEGERREQAARNLLGIRISLTTLGVLLVTLFAFVTYDALLGVAVLIGGLGVLVNNVQLTLSVPLQAGLRLGWVSALELGRQALALVCVVAFVTAGAGLLAFMTTPGIAGLAVLVPTALLVRRQIPLLPSFELAAWRAVIKPVIAYSIAIAAATLYFRLALIIVSLIATGEQLGYFSLSYRIIEALFVIPALLVTAAFPIFARAARDDHKRLGYAISRVFEVSVIAGAGLTLALALGAPLAVEVMGGDDFEPAAEVVAVQAFALGATAVNAVWGFALLSLHEHRTILYLNLGALVALAVAVVVLVPIDGARGAAIATALVEIAFVFAAGYALMRGRPHLRVPLAIVPKVALAAALATAAALASGLPPAPRVVLAGIVYVAALALLRGFPRELEALLPWRSKTSSTVA